MALAVWYQNLSWKNQPIRDLLSRYFPNIPIFIANDANMAGLASMLRLSKLPDAAYTHHLRNRRWHFHDSELSLRKSLAIARADICL